MTMRRSTYLPTEHEEQAAVMDFWRTYAPTRRLDPRLLFSIPNAQVLMGAASNPNGVIKYLLAEGLSKGVPDLFLAVPKMFRRGASVSTSSVLWGVSEPLFAGMFIEVKRKGGKPSKEQLEMIDLLRRQGYNCCICYGADECIRAIKGYLNDA